MSTGPHTIWVYWQNRKEAAEACAVRLGRMIEGLAEIDLAFSCWLEQGTSRAAAKAPFCTMPPQTAELAAIIQRGQARKDVPPEPWSELGFSASAWNGIDGPRGLRFTMFAGIHGDRRRYPNNVTVDVRSYCQENGDVIAAETLARAFRTMIGAWDAAWGCVCPALYTKRLYVDKSFEFRDVAPPVFRSGWMTYLSAPLASKITPPSGAIVEAITGGLLMRATDEVFSMDNPAHLAAADAIQAALEPLQFDPRQRHSI